MLRTLAHLEPEAYSKPWQRPIMKRFVKKANGYNYLRKLQLSSRYQLLTCSTLGNEYHDFFNAGLIFTPEMYFNIKKYGS